MSHKHYTCEIYEKKLFQDECHVNLYNNHTAVLFAPQMVRVANGKIVYINKYNPNSKVPI